MDIANVIMEKLIQNKGEADINLLKGGRTFHVQLTDSKNGVLVDNLGNEQYLPWSVFQKAIELLELNGGRAIKGDAMNFKLGESGLPIDSIEGYVAKEVYGKKINNSVFRRITPIANILIWAGVCKNESGMLILTNYSK